MTRPSHEEVEEALAYVEGKHGLTNDVAKYAADAAVAAARLAAEVRALREDMERVKHGVAHKYAMDMSAKDEEFAALKANLEDAFEERAREQRIANSQAERAVNAEAENQRLKKEQADGFNRGYDYAFRQLKDQLAERDRKIKQLEADIIEQHNNFVKRRRDLDEMVRSANSAHDAEERRAGRLEAESAAKDACTAAKDEILTKIKPGCICEKMCPSVLAGEALAAKWQDFLAPTSVDVPEEKE